MATYTEFCCRSGGSNLSAGTLDGIAEPSTAPLATYTSGTWVNATGVFTVVGHNPVTDGVAVGNFASVYPDATTGSAVFIGRITAVSTTTVTVSLSAKIGTNPVNGTTNTTMVVGGAWLGPNAGSSFPWSIMTNALTDSSGDLPRVNFKNDQTYSMTSAITFSISMLGPMAWQGYTTTFGDLGKATIDGGTLGASFNLVLMGVGTNSLQFLVQDLIFQNNGATGNASLYLINAGSAAANFRRCVFAHSRGVGADMQGGICGFTECEAYDCNQNNTANLAGFKVTSVNTVMDRCISHDHASGANCHGFINTNSCHILKGCIAFNCGGSGIVATDNSALHKIINCDLYNNTGDGIKDAAGGGSTVWYIENSNFVKNGGWGAHFGASGANLLVQVVNCGFGSGTQANTSGTVDTKSGSIILNEGAVSYASNVTPWNAPSTGDFRITLASAKNAGRGTFIETGASMTGTVAFPDIGAGQHQDSGGAASFMYNPIGGRLV